MRMLLSLLGLLAAVNVGVAGSAIVNPQPTNLFVSTYSQDYLRVDGTIQAEANIDFDGFRLTSVGNPVAGTDAANKQYVTNAIATLGGGGGGSVAGGTNYWENWYSSISNAGTVGGPVTQVVDFSLAYQHYFTATASPINIYITNSVAFPTNRAFDGRLMVWVTNYIGTAIVNIVNVRYSGGTNTARYSTTMGTVTNQMDMFDFSWSGIWTNATTGRWALRMHDSAIN